MVVHPGYGNYSGTLINALVYHIDNLPKAPKDYYGRPGLVHRIDKHTTGLLVVAKTELALSNLASQFFERTTERRYYALVWGDLEKDGTIIGNIGRSQKNRKVMAVYPNEDHGKHAVTHFKVLERFGFLTLIECKLETGRTHQIRVHFQSIGHPLFNDIEYGGNKILKGSTSASYVKFIQNCFELLPGQALHAKTLGFKHPTSQVFIRLESNLPTQFDVLLNQCRKYTSH